MAVKITIETLNELSRIIQFHRKQAGLSRISLSEIAGVGKTSIYDIEHGKESVQIITLLKVLQALNISIELTGPLMKVYEEKIYEDTEQ